MVKTASTTAGVTATQCVTKQRGNASANQGARDSAALRVSSLHRAMQQLASIALCS